MRPAFDRAHPGQRFHQFGLSIALYASYAQNLATLQTETETFHRRQAAIVMHAAG